MKIVAHCLVKNEENFIWYALNSVIDYVDEIMVWDQGSNDKTVDLIKSIQSDKIKFKAVNLPVEKARQHMLDETRADWLFILDGDEIWHKDSLKNQLEIINQQGENFDVVVNKNMMLIGDMYHYLEEKAGKYKIHDKKGHYNIRFIKNLPGLHISGVYPNEAYVFANGQKAQEIKKERILFSSEWYLHASFVKRSASATRDVKYEIGEKLPTSFYYPEVFFTPRPKNVPFVWLPIDFSYRLKALLLTPLKKIKRRLI